MQQYLRNAPARRLSYCKSVVFKLWLVAFVVMGMMAYTHAAYAFTLIFDQRGYGGNVWIQVQDPFYGTANNFKATYANGAKSIDFTYNLNQVLMSVPVKLSDIGAGGLNITFSESAVFYVFYDDPTGNSRTAAPSQAVSTQRFMPFELTMMGGTGDQGNLTAINYFTAPLSIRSYQNNPIQNPAEPVLQQTGFGSATAAQIGARFAAATGGNPNAVVKDANGNIVRYLGPTNTFSGTNPWPSFIPYTLSIHAANQSTTIQRTNGFNFAAPDNLPVYQFGADMIATANADGSITITGNITVSGNAQIMTGPYGNPQPPNYVYDAPTNTWTGYWSGATFSFPVSDPSDPDITPDTFNNAIYDQTDTVNVKGTNKKVVYYTGQAWNDFQTFTQNTLQDPTKPYNNTVPPSNLNYNPSLDDLGAYNTTRSMFIGEVTTGLIGGFFNSNYEPGGVPPAIKNMFSNNWWSLNPIVAFSKIQPQNPYYNIYANVVFDTSNNTVYGVPYSDRFGSGPLVNTVKYNGVDVNYWVLGAGAPLSLPNALPGILLLLLGN